MSETYDVSVIVPIHNAAQWLDECLGSIQKQECSGLQVEVSMFLDSCTDASPELVEEWKPRLESCGMRVTVGQEQDEEPKGVGYAKNRAVRQSCGDFLCFQDADDVMRPRRIRAQFDVAAGSSRSAIVGSRFERTPEGSTARFTRWANGLSPDQLRTQVFTSHGPTVVMPTWFCARGVFERVGGFDEGGQGTPEDLIFFFRHLRLGGEVLRVDEPLLLYRHHPGSATFSVHEDTLWKLRVRELEERVLTRWGRFSIWNAGRQGRKLYRSLGPGFRTRVSVFCDVDPKKVGAVYTYEESPLRPKPRVPIVHFSLAPPPIVICVKLDMTDGQFELNLASLNLAEGTDYHHFN